MQLTTHLRSKKTLAAIPAMALILSGAAAWGLNVDNPSPVPSAPALPTLPGAPAVPGAPDLPGAPAVPGAPALPALP